MSERVQIPGSDPLVGRTFADRFEVLERIGEGGMGTVYKARQVAMDRQVALKVIRPDQSGDETTVARFHREMRTASRVQHPNTVSVYDFGEADDGTLFLAMELLEGESLDARLDQGPMPLDAFQAIAQQILRALAAAHAENVVHRDLKPENIMLIEVYGETDQVRVLDFGIATFGAGNEGDDARVTASGIMVGTANYVSPEQITGEDVDSRADLYSLGILFYEMITGAVPFSDPTRPLRVLQMHMTEMPRRPSTMTERDVPAWLDDLILHMLAKYPEDRPESAEAILAVFADPSQAQAQAPSTRTRGQEPGAEAPVATGMAPTTVALLVGAAVVVALVGGVLIGSLL